MPIDNRYATINFFEHGFNVKNLTSSSEQEEAYKLRHKVFVDELGWVPPQSNCREIDAYDGDGMISLGVFDHEGRMIAHMRITLPQRVFMMEKEFSSLIQIPIKKTSRAVEVSRVCTEVDTRRAKVATTYGRYHVAMVLYKGLYLWCKKNRVHHIYMVIEYKLLRLLKLSGFPCREIGALTIMPDGVSAVAVRLNWREFDAVNKWCKPQLLIWFGDVQGLKKAA